MKEFLLDLIQGNHLALCLGTNVIAVPDVHGLAVELLLADNCGVAQYESNLSSYQNSMEGRTENEVISRGLTIADLLIECFRAIINVCE